MVELQQPTAGRPLITTTTILILSGFLIGMALAQPLDELSPYILNCGVVGLIAYLVCARANEYRERTLASKEIEQVETRLQRHLGACMPRSPEDEAAQKRLLEWLRVETELLTR